MKHLIALAIATSVTATLAGCGGSEPATPATTTTTAPAAKPATTQMPAPKAADTAAVDAPTSSTTAADAEDVIEEAGDAGEMTDDAAETTENAGAEAATPADTAGAKDEQHKKLIGTSWKLGDFDVTFSDADTAKLKGGPLVALAPNGLDAEYSYDAGTIEVKAMGQTKSGTWDGEKLIVDGTTAVKQ